MSNLLLEELSLANFRLYHEVRFAFEPGLNIILGANGSGKTSLLEGIVVTLTGTSFRTQRMRDVVLHGSLQFQTLLKFKKYGIHQKIALSHDGKRRRYAFNQLITTNRADILGVYPVVLFSQEDVFLVKGAPQLRRRYLDLQLAQIDPLYCHHLGRYTRALQQRNALLRFGTADAIESWEDILANSGSYLVAQRRALIMDLQERILPIHKDVAGETYQLELRYRPAQLKKESLEKTTEELSEVYRRLFFEMRKKEKEIGSTVVGPHRDDLALFLNDKELRLFASDGQQKACAASLRLAEWDLVKDRVDLPPLMLIDDIGTSLDPKRRQRLLELTTGFGQVIATAVCESELKHLPVNQLLMPEAFSQKGKL